MSFSNYFPKENFLNILNTLSQENNQYIQSVEKLFFEPFYHFLLDKSQKNELSPLKFSETHSTSFINAWNKLANNENLTNHEKNSLLQSFHTMIDNQIFQLSEESLGKDITDKYNNFINTINDGTISHYHLSKQNCHDCGQHLFFMFKNWKGATAILEKDLTNNKTSMVPAKPCLEEINYNINVNFPSGNLMIADWFRIEEFNKVVLYKESDQYDSKKSLNSTIGRLFHIQHYSNQNFVSIPVGNSSPYVYEHNNTLFFGSEKIDSMTDLPIKSNISDKGYVCTDLWNVSIIDKEVLKEILMKNMSEEKATETIDKYIEKNSIIEIQVNPGSYTINFTPKPGYLKEEKNDNNQEFIQTHDIFFYLKANKLKNTPKFK